MQQPVGVVLCGGKSSRMGIDKCLIDYHGEPQWSFIAKMLLPFCSEVIISCNKLQSENFNESLAGRKISMIVDTEPYNGQGPLSGVISAFGRFQDSSLLVVGCDYPLLSKGDIEPLIHAYTEKAPAVCYHVKEESLDIPFPAIYHSSIAPLLLTLFSQGDYSLRTALKMEKTIRLDPPYPGHLVSANSPAEVEAMRALIKGPTQDIR